MDEQEVGSSSKITRAVFYNGVAIPGDRFVLRFKGGDEAMVALGTRAAELEVFQFVSEADGVVRNSDTLAVLWSFMTSEGHLAKHVVKWQRSGKVWKPIPPLR